MKELDEITIRRAAKKDQQAFRQVYDYYSLFVWKVIFRTVNGDTEAAKEVVQETFIRVYTSLGSFGFNSALSTWIYRIAYNTANTYLSKKKSKRLVDGLDVDLLVDGKTKENYENKEIVEALLSAVSPEERFLLMGREVEGTSFEELARITGKSSEALRTLMSRLKARLRATYDNLNQKK
jgi:RNA polymerase sigma-70 factor (ECF subfamily)